MSDSSVTRRTVLVYEPVAEAGKHQDALAQRLPTLDGMVVGLLNNTKDLVDVLLDEVQILIQRDFPGARFRSFRKESVSGAAPAEVFTSSVPIPLARCLAWRPAASRSLVRPAAIEPSVPRLISWCMGTIATRPSGWRIFTWLPF